MFLVLTDVGLSEIFCALQSPVLDFGKIIIYTSNLRIIRAPPKKPEVLRHHTVSPVDLEGYPKARERGSRRRSKAKDGEEKQSSDAETKVMILGQIIPSGVVEVLSLSLLFSVFTLSACLLLPYLSLSLSAYVFSQPFFTLCSLFEAITAGSHVRPYCCNL